MRQDFILRLIEQLIATLHTALGLRREDDPELALLLIDRAMQDMLGWRSTLVNSLPVEALLGMLSRGERLDVASTATLALLLQAEGECYEMLDEGDAAYRRFSRALALLLAAHATERDHEMLVRFNEIPTLIERLDAYVLPAALLASLATYHEREGHYARAEDALWAIHALDPDDAASTEALRRFYHRLLALPDALLTFGDLPRDEVMAGLAEVEDER